VYNKVDGKRCSPARSRSCSWLAPSSTTQGYFVQNRMELHWAPMNTCGLRAPVLELEMVTLSVMSRRNHVSYPNGRLDVSTM
jgi:hypothetical protein